MWTIRWRRFGAGLALIAMLVLSLSQGMAAPLRVIDCCDDASLVMAAQTTAAIHAATPDDQGTPHRHGGIPDGAVCCADGVCSALSPVLARAVSTLPFAPHAIIHHEARALPPEGLGILPPLPPPRFSI
jgi:hypothetical protein